MKLYELSKSKKNIKEIELKQNPGLIHKYKEKRISRSDVYWFETTDGNLVKKMFHDQTISSERLRFDNKITHHSSIEKIRDTKVYSELRRMGVMSLNSLVERIKMEEALEHYMSGDYTCHNLLDVSLGSQNNDLNYCNHFLLLSDYEEVYFEQMDRYYYAIKNMLDLPVELYNLELLEQKRYDSFIRTASPWQEEVLPCYDVVREENIGNLEQKEMEIIQNNLEADQKILTLYRQVKNNKRA